MNRPRSLRSHQISMIVLIMLAPSRMAPKMIAERRAIAGDPSMTWAIARRGDRAERTEEPRRDQVRDAVEGLDRHRPIRPAYRSTSPRRRRRSPDRRDVRDPVAGEVLVRGADVAEDRGAELQPVGVLAPLVHDVRGGLAMGFLDRREAESLRIVALDGVPLPAARNRHVRRPEPTRDVRRHDRARMGVEPVDRLA